MDPITELYRLLANLIRLGTIAAVEYRPPRCRVQSGALLSAPLRWISVRAGHTATWSPPDIGEQVIVFSPGGDLAQGLVLCGLNSHAHPAPGDSGNTHLVRYPDGAELRYDHQAHTLAATLPAGGRAAISADRGITFNGPLTVNGPTQLNGDTGIKGQVAVDGGIEASGDVKGKGISLAHHKTTGVKAGSDLSGDPR